MGRDEQKEEREVLDSIFPEEIQDVSETEYRISIKLDVEDDDGDEADEPPTIVLRVSYPDDYPDVAPDLDLSNPPNAAKTKDLDIHEDKRRLLDALQPTIEENMGMAMVFALVSTLKDGAELLMQERRNAQQALKEIEAAKAEEEENRKFQGEAVTRESFLAWLNRFRAEMAEQERRELEEKEAEEKRKKPSMREEKRMTGRELWEKGLAGKAEDEDYEGDELPEEMQKAKLNDD